MAAVFLVWRRAILRKVDAIDVCTLLLKDPNKYRKGREDVARQPGIDASKNPGSRTSLVRH